MENNLGSRNVREEERETTHLLVKEVKGLGGQDTNFLVPHFDDLPTPKEDTFEQKIIWIDVLLGYPRPVDQTTL